MVGIAAVAATVAMADHESHSKAAARVASGPAASWTPLPSLPVRDTRSPSVSLGSAGGHLYVAVREGTSKTQELGLWRLDGTRWVGPLGGKRKVLRGAPLDVVDWNGTPCLQTTEAGVAGVECLSGRAWKRPGGVVFAAKPHLELERLFAINGSLVLGYLERSTSGVSKDGRVLPSSLDPKLVQLGQGDTAWRTVDTAGLAVDGRRFRFLLPFGRGAGLCVAVNDVPPAGAPVTEPATAIRTRCQQGGVWTTAAPDIIGASPHVQSDAIATVGSDTFMGMFRSVLPTGRYRFGFNFRVLRLRDGAWAQTPLGDENPNWLEQGRVYSFNGEPWALVFSQRPSGQGFRLHGKLIVRRLTGATAGDVGAPLLRDHEIYGPIHWDMTSAGGRVFVMYPQPDPRTRRNIIRIAVLRTK